MDNFKTIYKILKFLENCMGYSKFDDAAFTPERFNVTDERGLALLEMIVSAGYVDGVCIHRSSDSGIVLNLNYPRITLKGLEYLQENPLMQKAEKLVKGISDIIPH